MIGFRLNEAFKAASGDAYRAAQIADSPISLWPLAADASDIVGANSFTGTAPSFSSSPLYTGGAGYAVFTGSQNLKASYLPFALNSFTIEFVIQLASTTNLVILENNQNVGYSIQSGGTGTGAAVAGAVYANIGSSATAATGNLANTATHVVIEFNSAGIGSTGYKEQIFVNGSLVSSGNPNNPTYSSSSFLNLGSRDGAYGAVMSMAGLAFYAGNLTPTRIAAHAIAAGF